MSSFGLHHWVRSSPYTSFVFLPMFQPQPILSVVSTLVAFETMLFPSFLLHLPSTTPPLLALSSLQDASMSLSTDFDQ